MLRFARFGGRVNVFYFSEPDFVVLLDEGVEPVLDLVLRSSRQMLADFRPFAANIAVKLQNLSIFFFSPFFLFDLGVKLVDEPFPDLLAIFGTEHLRKQFPVLSIFLDEFPDCLVFLRRPDFMAFPQLREPPVAMEALVLISVLHEGCNLSPSLGIELVELQKLIVFFGSPCFDFPFSDVLIFLLHFHADLLALLRQKIYHKLSLHSSIIDTQLIQQNQQLSHFPTQEEYISKIALPFLWNQQEYIVQPS